MAAAAEQQAPLIAGDEEVRLLDPAAAPAALSRSLPFGTCPQALDPGYGEVPTAAFIEPKPYIQPWSRMNASTRAILVMSVGAARCGCVAAGRVLLFGGRCGLAQPACGLLCTR